MTQDFFFVCMVCVNTCMHVCLSCLCVKTLMCVQAHVCMHACACEELMLTSGLFLDCSLPCVSRHSRVSDGAYSSPFLGGSLT